MQAFRMVHWQEPPVLEEIEVPEPGPGEVRIKVAGNGLCQSDLHMPHIPTVMEELTGWAMEDLAGEVTKLTEGRGVDAVLDFVGTDTTIATSIACAAKLASYVLIGAGEGRLEMPLFGALASSSISRIHLARSRSSQRASSWGARSSFPDPATHSPSNRH